MKLRGKVAISRGIDPEIMKYEIMKYELGTSGLAQGKQECQGKNDQYLIFFATFA